MDGALIWLSREFRFGFGWDEDPIIPERDPALPHEELDWE